MLELATLGALMGGPQHGYALKAWLERYMGSLITVNYGAMYPLLRRLSAEGLIRIDAADELTRRSYAITAAGRKRFGLEMLAFPSESRVNARSRFITKFYFFSHIAAENRALILKQRHEALQSMLAGMQDCGLPAETHQLAVFEFAISQMTSELKWVEDHLRQELSVPAGSIGNG